MDLASLFATVMDLVSLYFVVERFHNNRAQMAYGSLIDDDTLLDVSDRRVRPSLRLWVRSDDKCSMLNVSARQDSMSTL